MHKKLIFAAIIASILLVGFTIYSRSKKTNKISEYTSESHTTPQAFTIVCEQWPPFEHLENGNPQGINVEIVDIIMKKLNIPYQIKFYPWARAWLYAKKGKADAVLSVSYKKEREKFLHYTEEQREYSRTLQIPKDYLWLSEYRFFIKKNKKKKLRFSSYEQVKNDGYMVGVDKSYSYHPQFWEYQLKTKTYSSNKSGFKALIHDEIDIYPMDTLVGITNLNKLGFADSITTLPRPLFKKPYHIMFTKNSSYPNNIAIRDKFYRELRKMRSNGQYKNIYNKYVKGL